MISKFILYLLRIFFLLPEKIRFILVGGYNNVLSIGLFSVLYILLRDQMHYLVIATISTLFAVIHNFLTLKFFVFRFKGSYLKSFRRSVLGYSIIYIYNMIFLFIFVSQLHMHAIIANILVVITSAIFGYIIHKQYSFRTNKI
jgi:putative flippase GtrA